MKLLFLCFLLQTSVGDVFDNGMSFQNKVMVQLEMIIKTSDTTCREHSVIPVL